MRQQLEHCLGKEGGCSSSPVKDISDENNVILCSDLVLGVDTLVLSQSCLHIINVSYALVVRPSLSMLGSLPLNAI